MNAAKPKTFYRLSLSHFIICVLLPLAILISIEYFTDKLYEAINVYTLTIFAILGVSADIAYKYRKKSLSSKVRNESKFLGLFRSLDTKLILLSPLAFAIFFFFLLASNNRAEISDLSNQESSEKAASNTQFISSSESSKELRFSEDGNHSSHSVPQPFKPNLDSHESMKRQFLKFAYNQLNTKNPMLKVSESEKKEIESLSKSVFHLLKEENWEELLALVDNRSIDDPNIVNVVTNLAANLNVPTGVLAELTSRGGRVYSHSLLSLVKKGEFSKVKTLENYGSSLTPETSDSVNALDLAFLTQLTPEAFEFIVNRVEVSNDNSDLGADTLGVAIINAETNSAFISYYLRELLSRGATIKKQHKLFMAGLKKDSNPLYHEIIGSVPELKFDG